MNKLIGILLFVIACNSGYCSEDVTLINNKKEKTSSKEQFLSVLFAKDCNFKMDKTDNTSGTLTLHHVNRKMTFFTDRPYRKAGQMETEKFMGNWNKTFKNDPPNAGFVCSYNKKDKKFTDIPIELHNPKYDSKNDRLIFDIKVLEKGQTVEDGNYGEIVLFIDMFGNGVFL
jgi:hypothetical protein